MEHDLLENPQPAIWVLCGNGKKMPFLVIACREWVWTPFFLFPQTVEAEISSHGALLLALLPGTHCLVPSCCPGAVPQPHGRGKPLPGLPCSWSRSSSSVFWQDRTELFRRRVVNQQLQYTEPHQNYQTLPAVCPGTKNIWEEQFHHHPVLPQLFGIKEEN